MSTKSGLPNATWKEEEIVSLLKTVVSNSAVDAIHKRVKCLDELSRRTIKDIENIKDVLIEATKAHGWSEPESSMLIEILSKLAETHDAFFQELMDELVKKEQTQPFLVCISRLIRKLDQEKKRKSARFLVGALMNKDSFTSATDALYKTLISIDDTRTRKETVESILPYLDSADVLQVFYAVRIASELGNRDLVSRLCVVLDRSIGGWYDGHRDNIEKNICHFFERVKDIRSLSCVLKLVESNPSKETYAALASLADEYPQATHEVERFLHDGKRYVVALNVLNQMSKPRIDLDQLFAIASKDIGTASVRETLKGIILKIGKPAKQKLLEMAKSDKEEEYAFAMECLTEIGVSVDEISSVLGKNPVLQLHDFFYDNIELEQLWQDREKLGETIKKSAIQKFDHFVLNLFNCFGLITLFVDPAGKEGVDIIAFSPSTAHLIIAGVTTGVLHDDLPKLNQTLIEMRRKLPQLAKRYYFIPIIFTSKDTQPHENDNQFAKKNGIIILTANEIKKLLEMMKTGRRASDLIHFLLERRRAYLNEAGGARNSV
jgi:hypothetical protein